MMDDDDFEKSGLVSSPSVWFGLVWSWILESNSMAGHGMVLHEMISPDELHTLLHRVLFIWVNKKEPLVSGVLFLFSRIVLGSCTVKIKHPFFLWLLSTSKTDAFAGRLMNTIVFRDHFRPES